jgi:hypothetical protein
MNEAVKVTLKDRKRVNPKTLAKGAEIEKEHTSSKRKAETIALQHIKEFPSVDTETELDSKYYEVLTKMEQELKKSAVNSTDAIHETTLSYYHRLLKEH